MTIKIAVVGLGALGCATLLALARKGFHVEGFEQYRVGNNIGASGGRSRQHRLIYGEGAAYTTLLQRASQLWHQLEQEQQTQLFWGGGCLTIGTPDSPWFTAVENSAKQQNLPHERLSRAALNQRFPRLNIDEDEEGIFDPAGGILLTHELLLASAGQAQQLGAKIHEQTQIDRIVAQDGAVELTINGKVSTFDRVIVTTGAWSKRLFPDLPISSRRLGMSFHVGKESGFDSVAFPPTMRVSAGRAMWNTQPLPDGKNFKFFVGDAELNELHDPELVATEATGSLTPVLNERLDRHVADAVNGAHRTIVGGGTWPEAYTHDQAPLIGELKNHSHVWIGIGLSGHGFKLAPALGELLSEAVAGEVNIARDWPLFSPERHFAEPQAVYSR